MPLAAKTEALRRTPSQARSRERVEKMLAAARDLIAEKGADALRMGEVAERAQVSIGSLYQFFPDKAAVIRTLAERYNAQGRACIADGLAGITDIAGLRTAFAALIDSYYGIFLSEPVMRDIWSGVQADPALRDLDREDSRINGAVLAGVMARLRPAADRAALEASAFLVMQLGEATMRLALSVGPEEGRRLVEIYKRMALAEIAGP
ncbi:MAG: TetR family transcriptional regulator [Ferrovibrionaceae bacterium]